MRSERECPHVYAKRRANETGRAYCVTDDGRAFLHVPFNTQGVRVIAVYTKGGAR